MHPAPGRAAPRPHPPNSSTSPCPPSGGAASCRALPMGIGKNAPPPRALPRAALHSFLLPSTPKPTGHLTPTPFS